MTERQKCTLIPKLFFRLLSLGALQSLFLGILHAQPVEAIKSGDVLTWRAIQLTSVGQDFADGQVVPEIATIKIDATTGERVYSYSTGNKTIRYRNKNFGTFKRNEVVYPKDSVLDLVNEKAVIGSKWKESVTAPSQRCGPTKTDFDVSEIQGPDTIVKVKGVPLTVRTLEIVRDGTWYSPPCGGSGRHYLRVLFSPDLQEIIHHETRIYQRGYLYSGEKFILDAVN